MELNYDWKTFQRVFEPGKRGVINRSAAPGPQGEPAPVLAVVEDGLVVAAFCEREDLSEWLGQPFTDWLARFSNRHLHALPKEEFDSWIEEALDRPHFEEQGSYVREKFAKVRHGSAKGLHQDHFLLRALRGPWRKILPNAYGIYLRILGRETREIVLVFRSGRLELFHEPELGGMNVDRRKDPLAVVKYLSEKHLVPIQGVAIKSGDWEAWSKPGINAWSHFMKALRVREAQVFPMRMNVLAWVAARAMARGIR